MIHDDVRFFPIGDSALTVEFGTIVSRDLNDRAIALSQFLEITKFDGFIESVPAYASTSVFYDIRAVRDAHPDAFTAFDAVKADLLHALQEIGDVSTPPREAIDIPVIFGGSAGPDLASLAESRSLTAEQVIEIFTSTTYRVYMLGFLPGFTYMGEVDERIAAPRRSSPRTAVAAGSVGIAARQTGIYSLESPGGWNIIGRTNLPMFTPAAEQLTHLKAGDEVRFIPAG